LNVISGNVICHFKMAAFSTGFKYEFNIGDQRSNNITVFGGDVRRYVNVASFQECYNDQMSNSESAAEMKDLNAQYEIVNNLIASYGNSVPSYAFYTAICRVGAFASFFNRMHIWSREVDLDNNLKTLRELSTENAFPLPTLSEFPASLTGTEMLYDWCITRIWAVHRTDENSKYLALYVLCSIICHQLLYTPFLSAHYDI
jgi:hypothetical protein